MKTTLTTNAIFLLFGVAGGISSCDVGNMVVPGLWTSHCQYTDRGPQRPYSPPGTINRSKHSYARVRHNPAGFGRRGFNQGLYSISLNGFSERIHKPTFLTLINLPFTSSESRYNLPIGLCITFRILTRSSVNNSSALLTVSPSITSRQTLPFDNPPTSKFPFHEANSVPQ
jgi:hypothetical protein